MIIPSNPGMFRRVDISDEDIDSFSPRKSDLKSLKSFKSDFTLKNSLTNSYRNKNFSFKVNARIHLFHKSLLWIFCGSSMMQIKP